MKILALLTAVLLWATASCVFTEPGDMENHGTGPIPNVKVGVDGPDEVVKTLGRPSSKANGWWTGPHYFDMEYEVWYYKRVGRVIFPSTTMKVVATEADQHQGALPD